MKAVRLGSYSSRSTPPTRPPPPRPPDLVRPSVRLLTGRPLCSSERSISTRARRPGEVGLYCFKAIGSEPRRNVDRLALGQRHDRFLDVGTTPHDAAEALGLALGDQGVDLGDRDLEQLFDRGGDLVLARVLGDA